MRKNKGFSLVELIIVIAIMAILVGIMVPVMMHFIEKSNVSSDYQLADTVRSAVAYSIVDARVRDDLASQDDLELLENPTDTFSGVVGVDISTLDSGTVLLESLTEYIGMDPSLVVGQIKSEHGADCKCVISTTNGVVKVTFTETDSTGKKKPNANPDIVVQ